MSSLGIDNHDQVTVDATGNITATGNMSFVDNGKATFGAGSDLQIYHDGNNSLITELGTGDLYIRSGNSLRLQSDVGEDYARFDKDGGVNLYYNGTSRINTTSVGANVNGTLTAGGISMQDGQQIAFGLSNDLAIYHDGSHSRIVDSGTGSLVIQATDLIIQDGGSTEQMARFYKDGGVNLSYNGTTKLATTGTGAAVTGDLEITGGVQKHLQFGGHGEVRTTGNYGVPSSWTRYQGIGNIVIPAGYKGHITCISHFASNYEGSAGLWYSRFELQNWGYSSDYHNAYGYHSNYNPSHSFSRTFANVSAGTYSLWQQVILGQGSVTLNNYGGVDALRYELWLEKL